ncbi:amidase [Mycobacterium sp. SMC-18]
MRIDEYAEFDGVGLAGLIRSNQISAAEVQAVSRTAIESLQPQLNAVVDGPWQQPLKYNANGPFAGVPFVLKDILLHAAGVPTHCGSRLFGTGMVHDHDTELMRRFREAGLAAMATTRTPEFGLSAGTEPVLGGATRNPWDISRTPGGSSGGTAALVAAGAVPLGHANDGGGSIRIPASFTGLVGLKPSRGRIPIGPDLQEAMYGLATELAITRTVRDTAAMLDAVSGFASGEKFTMLAPGQSFASQVGAEPGRLRIAVQPDSWTGHATDPGVVAAVRRTAETLSDLGHHVEFACPTVEWDQFSEALTTTWAAGAATAVYPAADALGVEVDENLLELSTLRLAEMGRGVTAIELAGMVAAFNAVSRAMGTFFDQWDLWLTATTSVPAPPIGHFNADVDVTPAEWVRRCVELFPYLAVLNVTGTPAISLPAGLVDGLPIGIQLAAPMAGEATLIRVAAQLEQVAGWADLRPAGWVGNGN